MQNKIISANFLLGFGANFLMFGSIFFLIPIFPLHLQNLGNNQSDIGIMIGSFSVTAILLRPYVGKLTAIFKKKQLMAAGAALFTLSTVLYPLTSAMPVIILLRIFHGTGFAFYAAASAAFLPDIVPRHKLGQATGLYVTSVSLATGVFPLMATSLSRWGDFPHLIYVSAAAGLLASILVLFINEPFPRRDRMKVSLYSVMLEHNVLVPTLIFTCCSFTLGTVTTFLPLFLLTWNYDNPGLFFAFYSIALIAMRFLAGSLLDRLGQARVITPSLLVIALSLMLLSVAKTPHMLIVCALLYGVGYSLAYPSLSAWVVEHSSDASRGSALGVYSSSVDAGAFLGPVFMGFVSHYWGYGAGFLLASLAPLAALGLFMATIAPYGTKGYQTHPGHQSNMSSSK